MSNVIGFAGRLRSGKGELSSICEKHGYESLYFAMPLKKVCSKLLNIPISELNSLKNSNKDINLSFSEYEYNVLSSETGIPYSKFKDVLDGTTIKNVRELLQVIGTDIIRNYDSNWHVNKLREMIKPDGKYVFNDVRFPNEKRLIEELGGVCWFVIRPNVENISHHESEESLRWQDFGDKVIINDDKLEVLRYKWDEFMTDYDNNMILRDKSISVLSVLTDIPEIKPFSKEWYLMLDNYMFRYSERNFNVNNFDNVNMLDGGIVLIRYKNGIDRELVKNPYNIEDLKFFLN